MQVDVGTIPGSRQKVNFVDRERRQSMWEDR